MSAPYEGRFWTRVIKQPNGCWEWSVGFDREGYGQFFVQGRKRPAHRVSYELMVGPIPDGKQLDHTCHSGNPECPGGRTCRHRRCVNPAHLEPVTQLENCRRRRIAGVQPNPELATDDTRCNKGHEYAVSAYFDPRGNRYCRTCNKFAARRSKTKKKEARAAARPPTQKDTR